MKLSHTQTKTTQNAVRPRSSNKRSRNLLKFENKSRFQVHTTTNLSFHHVYHVRCRLLLRAGSSSKYGHHVFTTSSIRPYNSHYDLKYVPVKFTLRPFRLKSIPPNILTSVDIFSLKHATQRSTLQ